MGLRIPLFKLREKEIVMSKPASMGSGLIRTKGTAAPSKEVAPGAVETVRKRVMQGKKEQISLTLQPDLVDQITTVGQELGLSRAAVINLSIREFIARRKA